MKQISFRNFFPNCINFPLQKRTSAFTVKKFITNLKMELIFIDYDLKLLRLGYIPDKISNTPGKRLHYTVPNSNLLTMTMIKY